MGINSVNGNTLLQSGLWAPCRVATTGAPIVLSGLLAIDGVALNAGDRVLVKDQTDPTTNGIYSAASGVWVHTTDAKTNIQFFQGMAVLVAEGTVNAATLFICVCSDDPVVIGASQIAFESQTALQQALTSATSTSSVTVGTGSKSFTVQAGKSFAANQWMLIWDTANTANAMFGQITSYSGTALVVNVVATAGSGTIATWSLALSNAPATIGLTPPVGTGNVTGPGSSTANHVAAFADGTGKLLQDGGGGTTGNLAVWASGGLGDAGGGYLPPGRVEMRYVGGAWTVFKPDGTVLLTSGTTTSGLQEAINYAQTNGYSLYVIGPGITGAGSNPAVIECTTPVTIGPIDNFTMRVSSAVIDFPASASLSGQSCVTLGTLTFCNIDFDCTVQVGTSCAYLAQVVSNGASQPGSNRLVQDNVIHLRTLICYGGAQTGVLNFDGATYSIQNNWFKLELVDSGGFAQSGISVTNPTASTSGFVQNIIDCTLVVDSTVNEVQIGSSAPSEPLGANVWRFGGITPSQPGMTSGLVTYASMDVYLIGSMSVNTGSVTNMFLFGSGSAGNQLYAGQLEQGVVDSGTNNSYTISGVSNASTAVQQLGAPLIYAPNVSTTASAANAVLNNSSSPKNSLLRSTSSVRYKTAIADFDVAEARKALSLRPVHFRSLAKADDPDKIFGGLIAEEVAQLFPQFVTWSKDEHGNDRPEAVEYDRIAAVPLLALVQDHERQIGDHRRRLAAIEARLLDDAGARGGATE